MHKIERNGHGRHGQTGFLDYRYSGFINTGYTNGLSVLWKLLLFSQYCEKYILLSIKFRGFIGIHTVEIKAVVYT